MYLVRDIMFCKPGQVRGMVQKFLAIDKIGRKAGFGAMRVMTDVSSERYWMVVGEMEVDDLGRFTEMMKQSMALPEFQEAMKGYHDLIAEGRREIYQLEN